MIELYNMGLSEITIKNMIEILPEIKSVKAAEPNPQANNLTINPFLN